MIDVDQKSLFRFVMAILAMFALALAGCDTQKTPASVEGMSPMEACEGELTDPACEQCCMKAGATQHDYDPVDDGDPRCTCFKPTN